MGGVCSKHKKREMHTKFGRKSLERPYRTWEDMRMDLRETGWEGVDWIHLAKDRDQ
jgi:hypothetical protein